MTIRFKKQTPAIFLIYLAILLSVWARFADMYDLGALLKNIRFLAPIVLLPIYFKKAELSHWYEVRPYFKSLYIFIAGIVIYTVLTNTLVFDLGFTYRNLVNLVLFISPLIIADTISRSTSLTDHNKIIRFIFFCYVVVFFIQLLKDGISFASIITIFNSNIVTDSDFASESDVSLVLGPFALYFIHYKKKTLAVLSILLTIIAAKRVAILGLGISIFVYYVVYAIVFIKDNLKFRRRVSILISAFAVFVGSSWGVFISGIYNQEIEEYTGLSVNRLFMGRINRFDLVFSNISEYPVPGFGYGLGYLENILYYKANFPSAFHNDFYRLYLEFGPILFGVWVFIMVFYSSLNRLTFSCLILLFLLMQTDNVIMYDRVMYSLYIICAFALKANYQEITDNDGIDDEEQAVLELRKTY